MDGQLVNCSPVTGKNVLIISGTFNRNVARQQKLNSKDLDRGNVHQFPTSTSSPALTHFVVLAKPRLFPPVILA